MACLNKVKRFRAELNQKYGAIRNTKGNYLNADRKLEIVELVFNVGGWYLCNFWRASKSSLRILVCLCFLTNGISGSNGIFKFCIIHFSLRCSKENSSSSHSAPPNRRFTSSLVTCFISFLLFLTDSMFTSFNLSRSLILP